MFPLEIVYIIIDSLDWLVVGICLVNIWQGEMLTPIMNVVLETEHYKYAAIALLVIMVANSVRKFKSQVAMASAITTASASSNGKQIVAVCKEENVNVKAHNQTTGHRLHLGQNDFSNHTNHRLVSKHLKYFLEQKNYSGRKSLVFHQIFSQMNLKITSGITLEKKLMRCDGKMTFKWKILLNINFPEKLYLDDLNMFHLHLSDVDQQFIRALENLIAEPKVVALVGFWPVRELKKLTLDENYLLKIDNGYSTDLPITSDTHDPDTTEIFCKADLAPDAALSMRLCEFVNWIRHIWVETHRRACADTKRKRFLCFVLLCSEFTR